MKIKNELKNLASKQEIHDLQSNILNKVDTSKVLNDSFVERKRSIKLVPILAGAFALLLVFGLGISIPFITNSLNSNKPVETKPIETTPITNPITENVTSNDSPIDFSSYSTEYVNHYFSAMETQEVHNIINVAGMLQSVTFDSVTLDTSTKPKMTVSEETAIVNDLNNYIPNIEVMLGMRASSLISKEKIDENDYSNKISVKCLPLDYVIYYNEEVIEEKNINEVNYKSNSIIQGVINCGSNNYKFSGTFRLTKTAFEYETKVELNSNKYVIVKEQFKSCENIFKYSFFDKNVNKTESIKEIIVDQKLNDDGTTREIDFQNAYTKLACIEPNKNGYIICKVKSRNGDSITIDKEVNKYIYTFKNSNNEYER
ncbi:MAG: hypothetical protein IJS83_05745 [Acholeplasmatales bacterium]|nr:hypothetical protein [Acholeplasmatales bacterium]